ncbi:MAG: hypothetical protein ABFS45_26525, partial [Pseudomonadota bacterium]
TESEDFSVLDASIGYRLPKRTGIISLEARNILNKKFHFQDESLQPGFRFEKENIQMLRPTNTRFIPDRAFLMRLILNF